jgi:hypothetical protein
MHADHQLPSDPAMALDLHRSPRWPGVERLHLSAQPFCVCCAEGTNRQAAVQVHHIFPFHECIALGRPDLELDPRNLITLCQGEVGRPSDDHHLLIGHLGSFESANLDVVEGARSIFHGMCAAAIHANADWQRAAANRPKPFAEMTVDERTAFANAMNGRFPKLG